MSSPVGPGRGHHSAAAAERHWHTPRGGRVMPVPGSTTPGSASGGPTSRSGSGPVRPRGAHGGHPTAGRMHAGVASRLAAWPACQWHRARPARPRELEQGHPEAARRMPVWLYCSAPSRCAPTPLSGTWPLSSPPRRPVLHLAAGSPLSRRGASAKPGSSPAAGGAQPAGGPSGLSPVIMIAAWGPRPPCPWQDAPSEPGSRQAEGPSAGLRR